VSLVPVQPHTAGRLLEIVREQRFAAGNLISGGGIELYNNYLRWSTEATRLFRPLLSARDLDQLICTRSHWSLRGIDPTALGNQLSAIVLDELTRAQADLEAAEVALRRAIEAWSQPRMRSVLPDTNFYLHSDAPFDQTNWATILPSLNADDDIQLVVPLIVVDELDRQKQGNSKAQARHTIRRLAPLLAKPNDAVMIAGSPGPRTYARLLMDDPRHVRLPLADDEIVACGQAVQAFASPNGPPRYGLSIVTFDGGMQARANAAGLDGVLLVQPDKAWSPQAFPTPE
jgi:hypothetical protein